jgi:uncharacterized membrane protein YhaH (DUF805 family)
MNQIMQQVISWSYPLASIIIIVLAATRKGLKGKPWLIAYLGVSLATSLMWRTPELLVRMNIIDSVSTFYEWFAFPLNIVGLAAFCLLIPYVLTASGGRERYSTYSPTAPVDQEHYSTDSSTYALRTSPITVLEALFTYRGRMSRSDYWLKGFLPMLPVSIFNNILAYGVDNDGARVLSILIGLVSIWPGTALIVKRLHDRDRSGWFVLTLLIPFIGIIFAVWIIIEVWFLKGTTGSNRFGNDPLSLIEPQQGTGISDPSVDAPGS